jgi:8-oxo-dGTP pyrophosphatase MutT (NUDIX family)
LASPDGELPSIADVRRHEDSRPYRIAAIRECFEESGILLANSREKPNELLILSDEEREQGRHAVHNNEIDLQAWIRERGGTPDVGT